MTTIPSFEYKQKMRREKQKEKKYFRYIARVILLFTKSMLTRRKYFLEKWLEGLNTDPTLLHEEQEKFRAVSIKQCHEFKSAVSLLFAPVFLPFISAIKLSIVLTISALERFDQGARDVV